MNGTLFLKMFIFAFMGFPIDQIDHYDILYQLHKGTCIRDVFKEEEFMDTNGTFSALFNSYLCHFSLWLMYLYLPELSVYVGTCFLCFHY